jgi:hypothetical protein
MKVAEATSGEWSQMEMFVTACWGSRRAWQAAAGNLESKSGGDPFLWPQPAPASEVGGRQLLFLLSRVPALSLLPGLGF